MTPRIVRAEAIHLRIAFRRPLLDATGEYTHRRTWLLRVVDESGRQGFGEASVSPTAADATTDGLARLIRAVVPELAAGRVPVEQELTAEGEPGRGLLAAITGAIDALSAAADERAFVPVSAVIPFGGPDAGGESAAQAVELGFGTLELRAGFERETGQLVDRLRAIRAAIGPAPRLRIDVGGAWDLETAVERMQAIERFRIEFVQQPLAASNLAGHAGLRERVDVPVALDDSIDSEGAARAALMERAADVLVLKPGRLGGGEIVGRIAALAGREGVGVVLASSFDTGVGIAAGLRIAAGLPAPPRGSGGRAHALATAGVLVHDLLRTPLSIDHGRMRVPGTIELEEAEVSRLALERVEATDD